MNSSKRASFQRAFSLVETALAIGIIAFTITGLAGLMPVAMDAVSEARNSVVITELTQAQFSEGGRSDFSALSGLDGVLWYDRSGVFVDAGDSEVYYRVVNSVRAVSDDTAQLHVAIYRHIKGADDLLLDEFISIIANNGR